MKELLIISREEDKVEGDNKYAVINSSKSEIDSGEISYHIFYIENIFDSEDEAKASDLGDTVVKGQVVSAVRDDTVYYRFSTEQKIKPIKVKEQTLRAFLEL